MKFDLKYLEKLAKLMSDSELTEMQLEDQEQFIVLKREKQSVTAQQILPEVKAAIISNEGSAEIKETETQKEETQRTSKAIKSPMVGTFYKAASPDAPAFVEVGSEVAVGDTVCIIEAMKLMNEIKSEQSGKVVKICVKNGDPVEFGQVLMYVE